MMAVVSRISQLICWNPKQFPRLGKSRLFLAPGPLQIPPGVMKAGGEFLSHQLAVLFTKTKAQCREPLIVLMWKGGMLVPLWKGKSSPTQREAYRSMFISNYTAKIYHQCLRTHLVNTWEASLSHLQCGGRPGIGADIAHHVVQCHQAWAKHAACPLDFRSAFYTVLRQTLTSLPSSNAAFVKAMHQLGLSEEETERMVITAEQDHATDGLSLHLQHILQDMMQCNKKWC